MTLTIMCYTACVLVISGEIAVQCLKHRINSDKLYVVCTFLAYSQHLNGVHAVIDCYE